jgi:hypothetical protein
MDRLNVSKIAAFAGVLVLGAAVTACNRDRTTSSARGHEGAPTSLTGCLQKGGGMTTSYVLTEVNEPTRSVGTSGSAEKPGTVAQEQMREAKHAYRLDGDKDQLDPLVGKQVRVEGTIAENSDLNKRADESPRDRDKPADIDPGDLAKVNVQSISAVADACGNGVDQRR